ncbi:hypothetical protein DCAR_0728558 [Daucus carota subsp. sativus]|uniref:RRM domain-containing protein n=1 Tax=Daucus carota subsp. sativus TaxID=79200 RepID=A0A164TNI2_DAUCS|nr:hypothetical protein DCAR_0728558 [Daucus carota subsp. sativus]
MAIRRATKGSHNGHRWEEVIAISEDSFKDIEKDALKWSKLIERDAIAALKAGNKHIFRFLVNRLERIRRCVGIDILRKVEKGDEVAVEEALKSMLLCSWEGPKVKIWDAKEQDRLEKGEKRYKQFILNNREWIDVNLQAELIKGEDDEWRVAGNQIHYKSMRNLSRKEYEENRETRYFVEALIGEAGKSVSGDQDRADDNGWTQVKRKKRSSGKPGATIFIAKIPVKAKARDLWDFFGKVVQVVDIILPRKRDRRNNRIGFVKVQEMEAAIRAIKALKEMRFDGVKLDIVLADNKRKYEGLKQKEERGMPKNQIPMREELENSGGDKDGKDSVCAPKQTLLKKGSIIDMKYCLVGFSVFPLKGEILQEVLVEMGMSHIGVKELSCWRYLLSFNSEEELNEWNGVKVKDWIHITRSLNEEDLLPKRRLLVQIRGLPMQYWSEENLKKISQDFGIWGWWCNRPDSQMIIENPLIWLYSSCLKEINKDLDIAAEGITFRIKLIEIKDDHRHCFKDVYRNYESSKLMGKDRKGKKKEKQPVGFLNKDSFLISHVSEIEGGNGKGSKEVRQEAEVFELQEDHKGKEGTLKQKGLSLEWDFPNSIDRGDRVLLEVGDLEKLDSSQEESLCSQLKTVKLKGVGRPRKKKGKGKCPFDIGRCKWWKQGHRRGIKDSPRRVDGGLKCNNLKVAHQIMHTASLLGLELAKGREEVTVSIRNQLISGSI